MNDAELYQACNQLQKRDVIYFLNKYLEKIKWKNATNRILDIGSGDGSVTSILKNHIPPGIEFKVFGADISEVMVDYANKHHRDENTSFTILDIASKLPEDLMGNFDHVFSFYALHWVKKQEVAFDNIYNLLADGGGCFMIFVAGTRVRDVYHNLQKKEKWSSMLIDLERYTPPYNSTHEPEKKLRQLMENIGFVDIEVDCQHLTFVYDNKDMAKRSLKSICPFAIPDDMWDEFMNDYLEVARPLGFMHNPGDGQPETMKMDYRILIAFARKPSKAYHFTRAF